MSRSAVEAFEREFQSYQRLVERALGQVDDTALLRPLDSEGNSIATLMQHMSGNLRSRFTDFLTSDGEKPDRNRDAEFELSPDRSRTALMAQWTAGWQVLFEALAPLSDADLSHTVTIRGEPYTILRALVRALAHQALHAGQVVQLARHWAGPAWQTLSIPKGQSDAFSAKMRERARKGEAG